MAAISARLSASSGATSPGKTTTVGSASAGRIVSSGELAISANPGDGNPHRSRWGFRYMDQQLTIGHLQTDSRHLAVRREAEPSHKTAPRRLDQMSDSVLGKASMSLSGDGHGAAQHGNVHVTRVNSGQRQAEHELLGQLEHVDVWPPVDFGSASLLFEIRAQKR